MLYIHVHVFGFGTARLGEWRLNHIHSINGAEVINASVSDSSAEIDYSTRFNGVGTNMDIDWDYKGAYTLYITCSIYMYMYMYMCKCSAALHVGTARKFWLLPCSNSFLLSSLLFSLPPSLPPSLPSSLPPLETD